MRLLRGLLGPFAVAVLVGGALAAPSYAADGVSIDHVQTGNGTLKLLVSVPGTAAVDLKSVSATVGGTDATATAQEASTTNAVQRTTVLAIDTSSSMRGTRIREATKAAQSYLDTVPANVAVGIVTFADSVDELLPPTTDRAAARSALGGLSLSTHTSLYDGVSAAVDATGTAGQRDVLLLSDGKDTTGSSLQAALDHVRRSGVKLDAVSLARADASNKPLNAIARAGRGTVLSAADPTTLTAAYRSEAAVLARQVLVTVAVPASVTAKDADVAITLSAAGQSYTGSAFVAVHRSVATSPPATHAPTRVQAGALSIPWPVALGAVAAIGLALLALLMGLFGGLPQPVVGASVEDQIGTYGASGTGSRPGKRAIEKEAGLSLADQAKGVAARALANNRSLEARIEKRLEAAGMAVKPAEWVLIHGGIAIAAGLVGGLLGAGNPLLIVIFLAGGAIGPWIFLGLKRSRRLRAFDSSLADTLQLMSGSLSAGLSLAQSIDTIVREGTEPVSSEFRRVVVEARLGVTLEDALEGVAQRMNSKDFSWVVMAIRIQRQVGGNLAELLLTVAATLREREFLRRHVKALSAEGRLSAAILGGLPPLFLVYLTLTKPDYVHPLYTTPLGWVMCVGIAVLLTVGIFWMSKVAKVDL
ncbi:type II secretion system F family protein [Nocardioides terrisoli]|uniref:type II secretion system F family protein n=1 Tax=Nocardioides terrisoli TaxID=3388267 RepID=UPI00287B7FF7|nr:type II secretion system F family protein [Nocardioides marmorisolisilvae]